MIGINWFKGADYYKVRGWLLNHGFEKTSNHGFYNNEKTDGYQEFDNGTETILIKCKIGKSKNGNLKCEKIYDYQNKIYDDQKTKMNQPLYDSIMSSIQAGVNSALNELSSDVYYNASAQQQQKLYDDDDYIADLSDDDLVRLNNRIKKFKDAGDKASAREAEEGRLIELRAKRDAALVKKQYNEYLAVNKFDKTSQVNEILSIFKNDESFRTQIWSQIKDVIYKHKRSSLTDRLFNSFQTDLETEEYHLKALNLCKSYFSYIDQLGIWCLPKIAQAYEIGSIEKENAVDVFGTDANILKNIYIYQIADEKAGLLTYEGMYENGYYDGPEFGFRLYAVDYPYKYFIRLDPYKINEYNSEIPDGIKIVNIQANFDNRNVGLVFGNSKTRICDFINKKLFKANGRPERMINDMVDSVDDAIRDKQLKNSYNNRILSNKDYYSCYLW